MSAIVRTESLHLAATITIDDHRTFPAVHASASIRPFTVVATRALIVPRARFGTCTFLSAAILLCTGTGFGPGTFLPASSFLAGAVGTICIIVTTPRRRRGARLGQRPFVPTMIVDTGAFVPLISDHLRLAITAAPVVLTPRPPLGKDRGGECDECEQCCRLTREFHTTSGLGDSCRPLNTCGLTLS